MNLLVAIVARALGRDAPRVAVPTVTHDAGASLASVSAPATACADSIAGMIPSVRDKSASASIASASVTGRYSARPVSAR